MPIRWNERFSREWKKLPKDIRKKVERILLLLDSDREHPSLRLKKLQRLPGFWEIRVDKEWRMLVTIENDVYI